MAKKKSPLGQCPCGSGLSYAQCCQPLHGGQPAPDAERLMRSRYSAYVLQLDAYLLRSWHPSTRPQSIEHEAGTKWLGLRVRSSQALSAERAQVQFEARYKVAGGSAVRMRESSRFQREGEHWFYLDGELLD